MLEVLEFQHERLTQVVEPEVAGVDLDDRSASQPRPQAWPGDFDVVALERHGIIFAGASSWRRLLTRTAAGVAPYSFAAAHSECSPRRSNHDALPPLAHVALTVRERSVSVP